MSTTVGKSACCARKYAGTRVLDGLTNLGVINLAGAEQGVQRVVAGDDEASNVDKKLASNVKEDEEEVQASETQDGVGLGDGCLLLEVVEGGVLAKLQHTTR
jgi:hypothetical protein